jgi:hypothetical protein
MKSWTAVVITAIVAGVALGWGGHAAWNAIETAGTPTCSWPLRVEGTASPAQAGLVRCYLRALADSDSAGLSAVSEDTPHAGITEVDLAHAADARAGLATATFTPSLVDSEYVLLTITYADRAQEKTGIINMVAMGGASGWRIDGLGSLAERPDRAFCGVGDLDA